MPYYPEHYITTGLYTNGNEYVYADDTATQHIGPYYILANGDAWSGQSPQDPYRRLLTQSTVTPELETTLGESRVSIVKASAVPYAISSELENTLSNTNQIYYSTNLNLVQNYTRQSQADISTSRQLPVAYQPIPTSENYNNGQFQRYFCKKANQELYLELDQKTYKGLKQRDPNLYWELYQPFEITWKLTGDKLEVGRTNQAYVANTVRTYKVTNFPTYLQEDYLKYYK